MYITKDRFSRFDDFIYIKETLEKIHLWNNEDLNAFKDTLKTYVNTDNSKYIVGNIYISDINKYLCYNISNSKPEMLLSIENKLI